MKQERKTNTVHGVPERKWAAMWVSLLWRAMAKTGNGYHRMTLKNQPPKGAARWRGERRKDKPGTTKLTRALARMVVPVPKGGFSGISA
jgi:hypothetical protein